MQTPAATLRLAVVPRPTFLTDALLIAGGAGLIAISAQISFKLPGTPIPITGQTFSVLLVGAALGAARGGTSALFYLLLGLLFPVYAGGGEGWDVIVGASGGYLVSYPFVAMLTGFLAERKWDRQFSSAIGAMLSGNVLIYLVGLPWLAVVANLNFADTLKEGLYPFVPGDVIKLYLAALALPGAWKLVRWAKSKR